ncbi:hypothetical protein ACFWJW_03400 [Streptomyces sp. NPDC127097]|uniref:hypothetical protein n=1 Tax=Streptomyces sp. NPDC127097 TaxID=3347136 RepID=UPI003646233C
MALPDEQNSGRRQALPPRPPSAARSHPAEATRAMAALLGGVLTAYIVDGS